MPNPQVNPKKKPQEFSGVSGPQKGPAETGHVKKTSKIVKSVKQFSTLFDIFRAGQKTSKIVKKCQNIFRHFSTIFARHQFSGPFWGALMESRQRSTGFLRNPSQYTWMSFPAPFQTGAKDKHAAPVCAPCQHPPQEP